MLLGDEFNTYAVQRQQGPDLGLPARELCVQFIGPICLLGHSRKKEKKIKMQKSKAAGKKL